MRQNTIFSTACPESRKDCLAAVLLDETKLSAALTVDRTTLLLAICRDCIEPG
jgi:hypothetical protein